MASWDEGRIELVEQFKILLLNNDKRVPGIFEVSTGGIDYVPVDSKVIFTAALKNIASGIIRRTTIPRGHSSQAPPTSHSQRSWLMVMVCSAFGYLIP